MDVFYQTTEETDVDETQAPSASEDCDPSYPDFCIPPAWKVGDLNCGDVDGRRFTVLPPTRTASTVMGMVSATNADVILPKSLEMRHDLGEGTNDRKMSS